MKNHLILVFEKIRKDFNLTKNFTIKETKLPFDGHLVYYKDKLVTMINNDGKSAFGFYDVKEEARVTLMLTGILKKTTICQLKRKI